MLPGFPDLNLRAPQFQARYTLVNAYRLSLATGVMAAGLAAGAEIFQLRWTHASNFLLLESLEIDGMASIAAFAAGVVRLSASIARGWSADGTGGAVATLTGNNQKIRTTLTTPTGIGAIRIATTAALGAGTKVLDAQPIASVVGGAQAVAGQGILIRGPIVYPDHQDNEPVTLATNEGLSIAATVPITGTWTAGITVRWLELALTP